MLFNLSPADQMAFAATRVLDNDYLGRRKPRLRLFQCACAAAHYTRRKRTPWMRLLPLLRLYKCARCGARVLRARLSKRPPYPFSVHYLGSR